jgi:hypothetical protein
MEDTKICINNKLNDDIVDEKIIEKYSLSVKKMINQISEKYAYLIENKKVTPNYYNIIPRFIIIFDIILKKLDIDFKEEDLLLSSEFPCLDIYHFYNIEVLPSIDCKTGWLTIIIKINCF